MPKSEAEIVSRHKRIFIAFAPKGTTLFSLAHRNREGSIVGARYFIARDPNNIQDVTSCVATIVGSKWNNKTGIMRTNAIGDAVDMLSLRLFDDLKAYKHQSL